jgi:hypothetical protein
MTRRSLSIVLPLAFVLAGGFIAAGNAQAPKTPAVYHKPADLGALLKAFPVQYPKLAQLTSLGKSAGAREIPILRIAGTGSPSGPAPEARPAILVAANLEGKHVIGTEAALRLAEKLLAGYAKDKKIAALLDARTIYVAPLLNPDGAEVFFAPLRSDRFSNAHPVDEDADGSVDEDGFEDLNKDGLITQMRVKDPEGKWISDPKEPRLMRLADPKKGEKGLYKIYSEGIDNDGDGEYNEDPPGGVELNRNFPHDFEYFDKTAGLYPVSEPETIALVKFMVDHPLISLVLNFSTENTILNSQQTGQAKAGSNKVKIPKDFAQAFGLDPEAEYSLKEIADAAKAMGLGGGMEITEEMVASFLGLGAAVQIDPSDQPILDAVQKDYKEILKAAKLDGLEKRPKGVGKGAFSAYVYFQYGVPVFSTDLWQIPEPKKEAPADSLTPDKLKAMTADQFLALGEEKIDAFLKEAGAPPNFNGKMLMGMIKSGQLKIPQMAEMMEKMPKKSGVEGEDHPDAYFLKWADGTLKGRGFVAWAPFKHPQLGDVEIGGFAPNLRFNPPPEEMEGTIAAHVDFYIKLMDNLPVLAISPLKAEPIGGDLYRLSAYVANSGLWPTSTGQGRRAMTAWPIRVTLGLDKAQTLFSGRPVEVLQVLNGGETRKFEWTIRAKKGSKISVKAWAQKLGTVEAAVVLN